MPATAATVVKRRLTNDRIKAFLLDGSLQMLMVAFDRTTEMRKKTYLEGFACLIFGLFYNATTLAGVIPHLLRGTCGTENSSLSPSIYLST
jgi:hypothetical protein